MDDVSEEVIAASFDKKEVATKSANGSKRRKISAATPVK